MSYIEEDCPNCGDVMVINPDGDCVCSNCSHFTDLDKCDCVYCYDKRNEIQS